MPVLIEYRVRPVVRYVVTRFAREDLPSGNCVAGSSTCGEFDNEQQAESVKAALEASDPDMPRTNGFLLVKDTHEVDTKAFFAHSLTEARQMKAELEAGGESWLLTTRNTD